jgi:hypothetical protein
MIKTVLLIVVFILPIMAVKDVQLPIFAAQDKNNVGECLEVLRTNSGQAMIVSRCPQVINAWFATVDTNALVEIVVPAYGHVPTNDLLGPISLSAQSPRAIDLRWCVLAPEVFDISADGNLQANSTVGNGCAFASRFKDAYLSVLFRTSSGNSDRVKVASVRVPVAFAEPVLVPAGYYWVVSASLVSSSGELLDFADSDVVPLSISPYDFTDSNPVPYEVSRRLNYCVSYASANREDNSDYLRYFVYNRCNVAINVRVITLDRLQSNTTWALRVAPHSIEPFIEHWPKRDVVSPDYFGIATAVAFSDDPQSIAYDYSPCLAYDALWQINSVPDLSLTGDFCALPSHTAGNQVADQLTITRLVIENGAAYISEVTMPLGAPAPNIVNRSDLVLFAVLSSSSSI